MQKGDAANARNELDRTFGKGKIKFGIVAEKNDKNEMDEKCLAVSVIHIHGMDLHALIDPEATPNVLSLRVVKKSSLKPEKTAKVVSLATRDKSGAIGNPNGMPIVFDDLQPIWTLLCFKLFCLMFSLAVLRSKD